MMARRTRSIDSLTAACGRPTRVVLARPRWLTSASTSQTMGSMPIKTKLWIFASKGLILPCGCDGTKTDRVCEDAGSLHSRLSMIRIWPDWVYDWLWRAAKSGVAMLRSGKGVCHGAAIQYNPRLGVSFQRRIYESLGCGGGNRFLGDVGCRRCEHRGGFGSQGFGAE